MIDIDPSGILVRYNVQLEKEMTPEDAAEELYPKDPTIYPIAKSIFEGEEDDVVEGLEKAIASGKDPSDTIKCDEGDTQGGIEKTRAVETDCHSSGQGDYR